MMHRLFGKLRLALAFFLLGVTASYAGTTGPLFNVSALGLTLTINTTPPNHYYPAAGIKINTLGYALSTASAQCSNANNGFCLFPVSHNAPASIVLAGPSGTVGFTLCLNGTGPLSCQLFSLSVVAGWTWEGGSEITNVTGTYGTLGAPASGNIPGARSGSISWVDASGNLWLFGGTGLSTSSGTGSLNDLWKYDIQTGLWTWVSGSNTKNARGTYGTLGTPASGNIPGARKDSISWTDASGNLWLFGGNGLVPSGAAIAGPLNDLWKYDIQTGFWTWVGGSNTKNATGTYGTLGTPASGNIPGARSGSISWADASGNLWLFGGNGIGSSSGSANDLNDLWKYDIQTGFWTWVGGSNTTQANGIYGTLGTPAPGNIPGARNFSISWADASGNLWLFGGNGFDSSSSFASQLNDLWKYDIQTGFWTWVGGSDTGDATSTYGTLGTPASGNIPGARNSSISWADASGNLWLFGGLGFDSDNLLGDLNDLWKYDIQTGFWTWVGGSNLKNVPGTYGTLGTPAPSNIPGARERSISWADTSGNLWLFGGNGYDSASNEGFLNDLWKY